MTVRLPSTPSPSRAAKAWTEDFAAEIKKAAGSSGRLTPKKAEQMEGMFADNAKAYFEKTGRHWAKVETVVASGHRYANKHLNAAAGPDKRLSLVDIRSLPADMVDDLLVMRGKEPLGASGSSELQPADLQALKQAIDAAKVPNLEDYNKWFDAMRLPSSTSTNEVYATITGLDDMDLSDWFHVSHGQQAVEEFAAHLREVGAEERYNFEPEYMEPGDATGEQLEKIFGDIATAAEKNFLPVSRFNEVRFASHGISEDGDTEHHILMARENNDDWLVLAYSDHPF